MLEIQFYILFHPVESLNEIIGTKHSCVQHPEVLNAHEAPMASNNSLLLLSECLRMSVCNLSSESQSSLYFSFLMLRILFSHVCNKFLNRTMVSDKELAISNVV